MCVAPVGRDPVDWFVRRAGLARFTTFACALGLSLAALSGANPTAAVVGLMLALTGVVCGVLRRASRLGSWLLVLSVLVTGLFAGLLVGTVRVAALGDSRLRSCVGTTVEAELVVTGAVHANSGWQSATAVIRHLGGRGSLGAEAAGNEPAAGEEAAVGETVWLEVAPEEAGGGSEASSLSDLQLSQGMIVACRGRFEAAEGKSESGFDQSRQLQHQGIEVVFAVDRAGSMVVLGRRSGASGWFDGLRSAARDHLSLGPDARVNEVLQGVVMGDTVGIDRGWLDAFRRSGTAHMLSVSGAQHKGHIRSGSEPPLAACG